MREYKKCLNPDCDERIYKDESTTDHNYNIRKFHDLLCGSKYRNKLLIEINKRTKEYRMDVQRQIEKEWGLI